MLKAIGFTDEDLAKPIIGVGTNWIETMPCNYNQRRLAEAVKAGIRAAGGTPMEFNTISVSDGVSMGTEGMKAKTGETGGCTDGHDPRRGEQKRAMVAKLERGLEHYEYFIDSIREGKPSRENAEEGHFAAGAAHLGNMAYRHGKKMKWDRVSEKVSEA